MVNDSNATNTDTAATTTADSVAAMVTQQQKQQQQQQQDSSLIDQGAYQQHQAASKQKSKQTTKRTKQQQQTNDTEKQEEGEETNNNITCAVNVADNFVAAAVAAAAAAAIDNKDNELTSSSSENDHDHNQDDAVLVSRNTTSTGAAGMQAATAINNGNSNSTCCAHLSGARVRDDDDHDHQEINEQVKKTNSRLLSDEEERKFSDSNEKPTTDRIQKLPTLDDNTNETNRLLLLNNSKITTANGCHNQPEDIEQQLYNLDIKSTPLLEKGNNKQQHHHQQSAAASANNNNNNDNNNNNNCKQKQLTYLQILLIRKWPYLALTIFIMGALIFGILLSILTVFLMHGQSSDCLSSALKSGRLISAGASSSSLSAAAAGDSLSIAGASSPLLAREFDSPIMMMSAAHLSPSSSSSSSDSLSNTPGTAANQLQQTAMVGDETVMRAKQLLQQQQQSSTSTQATTTTTSRFQRLPTSVWPVHYDLFFQPYLYEPFNFTGKVLIRIKCTAATDNITLHALDLDLNSTSITLNELSASPEHSELQKQQQQPSGNTRLAAAASAAATANNATQIIKQSSTTTTKPKVKGLSQDRQLQHSIIRLDGQLEPGKEYLLAIDFVGFLNDDLAGFYKIKYELKNSTTQKPTTTWIAATQFQATDARRAFPCFDEPLYKATFSIKIKHWKNMTSLSNMPIVERQDSDDGHWVTDVFEKSHRMSTYLVAFAVTNFESRSEGNISVWTRPGFVHTAEYSLRIAGKLLRYYEDFFGIEYPLPKMDMIALPDFNAGAMENWGLITYRETSMLFDESGSSIANKQRVATVVAHELAHQWFGNLVTPKWWDDLWLNEGFASYVEYIGVDKIEPSWKILDQFATEELQNVFRVDDLTSSHQISIPVNDPEEISEIFDHISYAKSASVIRMMHYFLTPEVFKTGLRRYLRALKYSNAEQSDLWAHLTEASKLIRANQTSSSSTTTTNSSAIVEPVDVGKVMNSWTLQVGYPLVTLTRKYDGSHGAQLDQVRYRPTLEQQQQQFLAQKNGTQAVQKWEVPITYTWKSENNFEPITRIWLHQNDSGPVELGFNGNDGGKLSLPKSDEDWMLVNLGQVGYYRVNYDLQNWRLLIEQLNDDHQRIQTTNRAQLLDDIFELARSGVLDYKFALDSTKYLKAEKDFLPWDTVLTSFGYIDEMLQRTPLYGQWQDYVGDLIKPYYARYKDSEHWIMRTNRLANNESDNALEQYNLVNAISWACQVDQHCITKAKSLFKRWKEGGKNEINPVVRFTVYCTAIENGDKDDWEFLWLAYEREQNSSERDRILKSLSCSKQMWILSRYLEWTFNKSKPIRRQDGAYIFRMIAKNNYGRDIAFNFVRERWTTIREHYGKTSFSLGALIRSLSYAMNTQIELQQLMNFYESVKSDVGTGKRSFQNAIEEVETNVQWRNRNYRILEDWISEATTKVETIKVN